MSESGRHASGVTEYCTLARPARAELLISRSTFIADLVRVESEEQARDFIEQVRREHPKARHHCTAFVLGAGARVQRSNDDGEPSGTAGRPMLEVLLASELSDVVAVVTRYFGGVLLGAAGLTRAYRAAVAEAVAGCTRMRRELLQRVTAELPYECAPQVEAEVRRAGGSVVAAEYGEQVRYSFGVRAEQAGELVDHINQTAAALLGRPWAGAQLGETGFFDSGTPDVPGSY